VVSPDPTTTDQFPAEPVRRRRVPAGQAIIVLFATLVLTLFLDADGLTRTAERQHLGWQRTVALWVMHPIQDVSHALLLNRPRAWIADATGHDDDAHITSTKGVEVADGKSPGTTFPGATTTTTTLPSYRRPTSADPLRVLVAGDSLSGHLGPSMSSALSGKPATVTLDEHVGTGLARPDVVDWPTELSQDMANTKPDVVVLIFGGNDNQDLRTADGWIPITHHDEWKAEYQRRIAQIMDIVAKPGVSVYWLGLPVMARPSLQAVVPEINAMIAKEAAARPHAVTYVDPGPALNGPKGGFAAYLPGPDGRNVMVRESDGVHPTSAGMDRIVALFAPELIRTRHLDPPPPPTSTQPATAKPAKK
jgi:hypothetical protein